MRKPRARFREFLLLGTLASLVVAGFALRAKVADFESAADHALRAQRARVSARYPDGQIDWNIGRMETVRAATDKADWQARLGGLRARHAEAAREAEYHERLGRYGNVGILRP